MDLDILYSAGWEVVEEEFYFIVGNCERETFSTKGLPFHFSNFEIALTMDEVDEEMQKVAAFEKVQEVPVKQNYLSGDSLQAYLLECYGKDVELLVCPEEIRLRVLNLKQPFSTQMVSSEFAPECRRPGYLIRGASITPEQAYEINLRHSHPDWFDSEFLLNPINLDLGLHRSFVHWDGSLGIDDILDQYATMMELLKELIPLAARFPYLDFILVACNNNEWMDICRGRPNIVDIQSILEGHLDELDMGLLVKDGCVQILRHEEISPCFQGYYEKYDANFLAGKPITGYDWVHDKVASPYARESSLERSAPIPTPSPEYNLLLRGKYQSETFTV